MVTSLPFRVHAPAALVAITPSLPPGPPSSAATWRVAQLVAALCLLSLADLFFTIWAHRYTPFTEANPFARALLQRNAITGLVLMKISLTVMGVTIFWSLRRHRRAVVALYAMNVVYVMLMVRWSDYTAETMTLGFTGA